MQVAVDVVKVAVRVDRPPKGRLELGCLVDEPLSWPSSRSESCIEWGPIKTILPSQATKRQGPIVALLQQPADMGLRVGGADIVRLPCLPLVRLAALALAAVQP